MPPSPRGPAGTVAVGRSCRVAPWGLAPRRSGRMDAPMRLQELTAALDRAEVRGDTGVHVKEVTYRSGQARPGALFFAVHGTHVDGNGFAGEAVRRGAV